MNEEKHGSVKKSIGIRRRSAIFCGAVLAFFFSMAVASAQAPSASKFPMGRPGYSGCLVCHSDKNLSRIVGDQKRSLYVDPAVIERSVHKDLACSDCHVGFSNEPHRGEQKDYLRAASIACISCKDHQKQKDAYGKSAHGQKALIGDEKAATCGDCHGNHNIRSFKKDKEHKAEFRTKAKETCGSSDCHLKWWKSYNDYYHGRAYKQGASDAPPCWDCHGVHKEQPAKQAVSLVSGQNLPKTCGQCHKGSSVYFVKYAPLIHGELAIRTENPVMRIVIQILSWIDRTIISKF